MANAEVHVKVVPELSPEMEALLGAATEDTLKKVNAGAALVYALYHAPADWWLGKGKYEGQTIPDALTTAYMQACEAYGVGRIGRS